MNSSNSVDINGHKIRSLREQRGVTQLYLATVVGVTTDTISRWENRRYPSIKLDNAKKLAEALEVPLEDLLEEGEADTPVNARQDSEPAEEQPPAAVSRWVRVRILMHRYRTWLVVGVGLAAVIGGIAVLLFGNRSAVNAIRIMPAHTAPNLAFPVKIVVSGDPAISNTLLIREEVKAEVTATGGSADGAAKQFGKNPRWIGKLQEGKAAFLYVVEPDKRIRPGEEIRIAGDLIAREGQTSGDAIDGSDRIMMSLYHWADSDKNYVISDAEIRSAYETYSVPGENLLNFSALEELWVAGGYAWNKKTQSFVAAPPGGSKEQ